jgi:hypothetical protein
MSGYHFGVCLVQFGKEMKHYMPMKSSLLDSFFKQNEEEDEQ